MATMKEGGNGQIKFNKLIHNLFYAGLPLGMMFAGNMSASASPVSEISGETYAMTQQNQTLLKGNIKDETGLGLPGVSVVVKGTTNGTITDYDGNYSLEVPANAEIIFSYIGYKSKVIKVAGKTALNITMDPDQQNLDEVVVIGYGTVKKRDLTGAVTSMKSEDITISPTANPMSALQGKVAGLDITRSSGKAGDGVNVQLRGNRSFSASGTPTFIIDGMPGDYSSLNPNDIESIEILKDAASTAVYGTQGANGVIIITTKKAKTGKPMINFNAYASFNGWATVPEVRSGDDYLQLRRDAHAAVGNWNGPEDDAKLFNNAAQWEAVQNGQWVDWVDLALGKSYEQNYSLSVTGGSDNTKAYFSVNFTDENGLYVNDNNKIYSLRTNIDQTINKWVTAGMNIQLAYVHNNTRKGILTRAMTNLPLGSPFFEDGTINPNPIPDSNDPNILTDEIPGVYKNQSKTTRINTNVYLDWKPFKGFSLRTIFGANLRDRRRGIFKSVNSYDGLNSGLPQNESSLSHENIYNYKWENILTYNFQIAKDHDFTLTGVTSWSHNQAETSQMDGKGMSSDKYLFHNMGANANQQIASNYTMTKQLGFVGRLNYSYKGKYMASVSTRWDGDSRLASGNKWSAFPGGSAGWRINEEAFMEDASGWLDNLKLRVGYGKTGLANIDAYSSMNYLETNYISIGGIKYPSSMFSQKLSNNLLSWETSYNTNIGLDMSVLNSRVNLTLDWYNTETKGVIYNRDIPSTSGGYHPNSYYTMMVNTARTNNKGVEIALNTVNIQKKDFTWSSTLTFSRNNEKIKELLNGVDEIVDKSNKILKVGEPMNSFYHYKIEGIWQNDEAEEAAIFNKKPGDIKIATRVRKDGDGYFYIDDNGQRVAVTQYEYSSKDQQVIGHNSPSWMAGLMNNFRYRDFDFSFFIYGRWGQMIKYGTLLSYDPKGIKNSPRYFNYWTPENPSNDFPAANKDKDLSAYTGYDALQYVDGSFFKIKNITLGYTLPQNLLKKAQMEKLRVYATLSNPFIFTKSHLLKDYDPEMNGDNDFPLTKQFVVGINLTF